MPIYEYRCRRCGNRFELLIFNRQEEVSCPGCESQEVSRLVSRFSVHEPEEARAARLDRSNSTGFDFYRDDRNVGLWVKKRAKELGLDMGSKLDELVEEARTRRILEKA
jgi:putative FmdB family regulatory protein